MDISREILQFLHYHPLSSRDEIAKGTAFKGSDATLKRLVAAAVQNGDIAVEGKARSTRYRLSDQAHLLMPLNLDTYFIWPKTCVCLDFFVPLHHADGHFFFLICIYKDTKKYAHLQLSFVS